MTDDRRSAARDERGFILVGVVTFMLALTILGLSLFALSGYEAQFFGTSATREQALQNCESGMGLVQALLESHFPRNLENAQLAVGQVGITRAIAYQPRGTDDRDTVSTGSVNWDKPIFIEVSARSGSAERSLYARYMPVSNTNPYRRLLSAGRITYNDYNPSKWPTVRVNGRVWQYVQSAVDTAWTRDVIWSSGRPVDPSQAPLPLADDYVDASLANPLPAPGMSYDNDPDNLKYFLTFVNNADDPSTPSFFRSPDLDDDDARSPDEQEFNDYSYYSFPTVDATVKGTVVWVVPQGICLRRTLIVRPKDGARAATLIIVAKANRRDRGHEDVGIWLQGGIDIAHNDRDVYPTVYLVSQGDIAVTHHHAKGSDKQAETLSVVAGGSIEIGGPESGNEFRLGYVGSMDALSDELYVKGVLPPAVGGSATAFTAIRGFWRETTPR